MIEPRDHGGALDAACARWGGTRADWIDLSTGINPVPFPLPDLLLSDWAALPDAGARTGLEQAARAFWNVPPNADILAAPGASCLISALPRCLPGKRVQIRTDTYNEHAAAFQAAGWAVSATPGDVQVVVHPNNPTGEFLAGDMSGFAVIDESFCDTAPHQSFVHTAGDDRVILKSFGKFWGLAGLRLGFAIGAPDLIAALRAHLGPWPVAGPALRIGTAALKDHSWADETRIRLAGDAARLDALMQAGGATVQGDCPLFRLYTVPDASAWHAHFAAHKILTRTFPYNTTWLRLGLPAPEHWHRVKTACGTVGGAMAQPSVAQRP
ncbi:threonine-phosphate decarboxylase [Oceaniglobus ichthyenteri]|uniref:threonine-phosphate decarboxylase n=1 Tax=Oceaniglobus ichthyenteri TaxID=2136177 RepID=UPI000D350D09|nr:threonine-phosphate decarboxylase [Oceaniglobus ichthyenteri]